MLWIGVCIQQHGAEKKYLENTLYTYSDWQWLSRFLGWGLSYHLTHLTENAALLAGAEVLRPFWGNTDFGSTLLLPFELPCWIPKLSFPECRFPGNLYSFLQSLTSKELWVISCCELLFNPQELDNSSNLACTHWESYFQLCHYLVCMYLLSSAFRINIECFHEWFCIPFVFLRSSHSFCI